MVKNVFTHTHTHTFWFFHLQWSSVRSPPDQTYGDTSSDMYISWVPSVPTGETWQTWSGCKTRIPTRRAYLWSLKATVSSAGLQNHCHPFCPFSLKLWKLISPWRCPWRTKTQRTSELGFDQIYRPGSVVVTHRVRFWFVKKKKKRRLKLELYWGENVFFKNVVIAVIFFFLLSRKLLIRRIGINLQRQSNSPGKKENPKRTKC